MGSDRHIWRSQGSRRAWPALAGVAVLGTALIGVSLARTPGDPDTPSGRPPPASAASKQHAGHGPGVGGTPTSAAARPTTNSTGDVTQIRAGSWSDPATWDGGLLPGPESRAVVSGPLVVDRDIRVAGVLVTEPGSLTFADDRSVTMESSQSVIVEGQLRLRPAAATVTHSLRFVGIDETRFVGGGDGPVLSDVGLWVVGDGRLDLQGTPRSGWLRASHDLSSGSRRASLETSPQGWHADDELVFTPTAPPTVDGFASSFDVARIASTAGSTVDLEAGLIHDHPVAAGIWAAEVANLTRNVRIEGTAMGRAHIWIRSTQPQVINHVLLRHLGPRQPAVDSDVGTTSVLGRYALHFHMAQEGSRGSQVVGTVVRDAGSHAFVPHASHGITFSDTVSFNTLDEAYWWDLAPDTRSAGPETHGTTIEHAMAALVHSDPEFRGYRLAGFSLAQGTDNVIRDSVAVGIQGARNAAGYKWPASSGTTTYHGVWEFSNNVSHNNAQNGLFVWLNDGLPHVVSDLVAYHNGGKGIEHGAYGNRFHYTGGVLYGNKASAIDLHAVSAGDSEIRFDNITLDGGGISDYLILSYDHTRPGTDVATLVRCSTLRGARVAAVWVSDSGDNAGRDHASALEFQASAFDAPTDVIMTSTAPEGSVVRIAHAGGATTVRPSGRTTETRTDDLPTCPVP